MRRIGALAILLAALEACSSAIPGSTSTTPRGRPPQRVGEQTFCNLLAPIRAAGRLFYPSTYPAAFLPPAQRCFASVAEARAAGLRRAPPPPGSRLMAGIYLVPTGRRLMQTCERSARRLGFAVACPGLAPSAVGALEGGASYGRFILEDRFGAPASYVGAGTYGFGLRSTGHLWFESERRVPKGGFCTGGRFLFSVEVGGRNARYVSCPHGSETHSGHVLLTWREAGGTHVVSLHGHTVVNRRIDFLLARTARIVRP